MPHPLDEIIRAHKQGEARGIPSVCSAHPWVLAAASQQARQDETLLLVESTCNQVNQFGGYTSMTPESFTKYMRGVAVANNLPSDRLIFGGDHLGPSPWQNEPAAKAMQKSIEMVQAYVCAGYTKIHLDTSMPCIDDETAHPLDPEINASRAADLCTAAEDASGKARPVYVIGTEVPPPGGARAGQAGLTITNPDEAHRIIDLFRRTFHQRGLAGAWERVIALVVQPGVEFGVDEIHTYDRDRARGLSQMIESVPGIIFEAHSTDYQLPAHLKQMVEDHFAILKVGPALTFAFREAVFALAHMEHEWLAGKGVVLSNLIETADQVMLAEPKNWLKYYPGTHARQTYLRKYSLSDRIRYYWTHPALQAALERLVANLRRHPAPLALLSQHLPRQYENVRSGMLSNEPHALVYDQIRQVLVNYHTACTPQSLRHLP